MTNSYIPLDFQFAILDVKKDIDVNFDIEFDSKFDINLDIYKDVDVDVDIKTDVDLDGNYAVGTGVFETINPNVTLIGDLTIATTTNSSAVLGEATAVKITTIGFDKTTLEPVTLQDVWSSIKGAAVATGYDTYAELDINVEVYDFGSLTIITGESATD